jgi:integrase
LRWDNVGQRTLLVENSNDDGELKDTKTGRIRTVRLLAPVLEDLAGWRSIAPPAHDAAPLFPRPVRAAWTDHDYKNWHRRHFKPASEAVGLGASRPYSFASLMIQAGYSAVELAAELGHSPTLTLDTYSHVFSEYARGERVDPVLEIRAARERQSWRTS